MWVSAWTFLQKDQLPAELSYADKRKRGEMAWKQMSASDKIALLESSLRAGWSSGRTRGAPRNNENAKKQYDEPKALSGMGFLLTWHQPPVTRGPLSALLRKLMAADVDSMQYEALMSQVCADKGVKEAWAHFQEFLKVKLPTAAEVTELSVCMEVCMHIEEPRYHFHAMISMVKPEVGRDASPVTLQVWKLRYKDFLPYAQSVRGRGRQVALSVDRGHCYCQLPKVGSLGQFTNYPRGKAFVCKADWILSQWKQRKLTTQVAREEIIFSRDRVQARLLHLSAWEELHQQSLMEQRQRLAKRAFDQAKRAFKKVPEVQRWMQQ